MLSISIQFIFFTVILIGNVVHTLMAYSDFEGFVQVAFVGSHAR